MPLNYDTLIPALCKVESADKDHLDGNAWAHGDKDLVNQAYGILQIRQPYLDDALLFLPSAWRAQLGDDPKAESCLGNRELSIAIVKAYLKRYATVARLGHLPTQQDCARIHNGGPNGYRKATTVEYWEKVEKLLPDNV